jgi:hypothetical protein
MLTFVTALHAQERASHPDLVAETLTAWRVLPDEVRTGLWMKLDSAKREHVPTLSLSAAHSYRSSAMARAAAGSRRGTSSSPRDSVIPMPRTPAARSTTGQQTTPTNGDSTSTFSFSSPRTSSVFLKYCPKDERSSRKTRTEITQYVPPFAISWKRR